MGVKGHDAPCGGVGGSAPTSSVLFSSFLCVEIRSAVRLDRAGFLASGVAGAAVELAFRAGAFDEGLAAGRAGVFRKRGFGPGLAGLAVVVGQDDLAVGIRRAAPEPRTVLLAPAAVQGRAAGRTRIGGLAVAQNGGKQIRQNLLLFRKKGVERFPALGDGFKAGLPFRRGDGVFERVRGEVDDFPAQRRGDDGLFLNRQIATLFERFENLGACGLGSDALGFPERGFGIGVATKRWTLAIASMSVPSEKREGGEVFFFTLSTVRQVTASPCSTGGRDSSSCSSSSSLEKTVHPASTMRRPVTSQRVSARLTAIFRTS